MRDGFKAVVPPPRLRAAADLFDQSLAGYLDAIDAFVAASVKTGEALKAAITAAVPIAERADKTYDRAKSLLDVERKRVGLPSSVTV